ncbi:MAG TPA: D-2-hydroxyacid dehydrogenase [Anaerolineae bacterium]|nr:D-2-hydroxyacid dehydrogenase [Anaerolineae bacterium]HMR65105.1 D-2-hydroxyacid dehydrogenase [Anaerolineae bacterium]
MMQTTILSSVDFSEAQLNKLRAVSTTVEVHQMPDTPVAEVPEAIRNRVNILYGWGKFVVEAHLCPKLDWLQTHSAGIDYLLDTPLWQSQVKISTMNGIHAIPMAEFALTMMLAFRWKLPTIRRFQHQTKWPQRRWEIFAGPELRGLTLGIIGYGAIGRELARQATALGMRVLALNRSGKRRPDRGFREPGTGDPQAAWPEVIYPTTDLLKMLPHCDYVVLLAPLTSETHHLISTAALEKMKPTGVLINLARGALVDEAALVKALNQQQITGAALDVFEEEPLPADNPLWQFENVILSPHISGFTPNYDERASELFAENLRRYLNREPLLNLVERAREY